MEISDCWVVYYTEIWREWIMRGPSELDAECCSRFGLTWSVVLEVSISKKFVYRTRLR
jgi:hypothetical protein